MLRNIRFYILLASGIFSLIVYFVVNTVYSDNAVQITKYTELYSLTAAALLYITLLIGPVLFTWKTIPYADQIKKSRRALGVSSFYFALLHACFAFFGDLGGFEGLSYLGDKYLFAVIISFIALIILYFLAITSFDAVIQKMTFPRWKILQRFVYVAGVLIIIHAVLIGSDFQKLSDVIPQIFYVALAVLFFLEAQRFDSFLEKRYANLPSFGITSSVVIGSIFCFYLYSLLPNTSTSPLSTHSGMQMSQNSGQNTGMVSMDMSKYPGMDGDKTKRYTTSFSSPNTIQPQTDATLNFTVYDAASGKKVQYFKNVYSKPSHLVIADSTLTYFAHIHPTPTNDGFTITTQFPKEGEYHLYLSFQPFGAVEQQMAFTVTVGSSGKPSVSTQKLDTNFTKTFNNYQVTMDSPQPLLAENLSNGQQMMSFTLKDGTGKPVTTLKPYLDAFGHLVMINQQNYEYLHVHPTSLTPPKPGDTGGPKVTFMPLGLYGPVKPGIYRIFAEFNPDGSVLTADFTLEVK